MDKELSRLLDSVFAWRNDSESLNALISNITATSTISGSLVEAIGDVAWEETDRLCEDNSASGIIIGAYLSGNLPYEVMWALAGIDNPMFLVEHTDQEGLVSTLTDIGSAMWHIVIIYSYKQAAIKAGLLAG